MAKEKLLLQRLMLAALILLLNLGAASNAVLAEPSIIAEDKIWAEGLHQQARESLINNLKQQAANYSKEIFNGDGLNSNLAVKQDFEKPAIELKILVSSSMPIGLLKSYARTAANYGAILVFCGLPEGSFVKLSELIAVINDPEYPVAVQIDDQVFEQFAITAVPTIVLSKEPSFAWNFEASKQIPEHDKISGNVPISYALEVFASNGDLAQEALSLIKEQQE